MHNKFSLTQKGLVLVFCLDSPRGPGASLDFYRLDLVRTENHIKSDVDFNPLDIGRDLSEAVLLNRAFR